MPNNEPTITALPDTLAPRIISLDADNPVVQIDTNELSEKISLMGISDDAKVNSAILIDSKPRLLNHGTHYPNKLGRLRFPSNEAVQQTTGDIIRISTNVRGNERTNEQMNATLLHELEHLAQADRNDPRVPLGWLVLTGLVLVGGIIGYQSTIGATKIASTIAGNIVGYGIGHILAPHEVQARRVAGQSKRYLGKVSTNAIKRL